MKKVVPCPVAQSVVSPTADPGSHTFMEIDHEIISMVILLLQLIQEGLLSVTCESMSHWITGLSLMKKVVPSPVAQSVVSPTADPGSQKLDPSRVSYYHGD